MPEPTPTENLPPSGTRPEVILEVPEPWFTNPDDGHHNRKLYDSLRAVLSRLNVQTKLRPLAIGMDRAPRIAAPGELVISYHSFGEGPGVLRLKESYIPRHYTMDRMGYAGFSELGRYPERFSSEIAAFDLATGQAAVAKLRQDFIERNLSKYRQLDHDPLPLPAHYLFFPLQTVDDPVAALAQIDQFDVLDTVLAYAKTAGLHVIVKRHPWCRAPRVGKRLASLARTHPELHLRSGSVHQYIAQAEAVIGGNSGVLFESLIHGRPVISFAGSDYRPLTVAVSERADIPAALSTAQAPDPEAVARFVGWYLNNYTTRPEDIDHIEQRIRQALSELPQSQPKAPNGQVTDSLRQMRRHARRERIRRREAVWGKSLIIRLLSRILP